MKHPNDDPDFGGCGFSVCKTVLFRGRINPNNPKKSFGLQSQCQNGSSLHLEKILDYQHALARAQELIDDKLREREHYLPRLQSSLLDGAAETSA